MGRGRLVAVPVVRLATPALTDCAGEAFNTTASVELGPKPILRIDGTPGQWYLATIHDVRGRLAIDFGARWSLLNAAELIAEAQLLVMTSKAVG